MTFDKVIEFVCEYLPEDWKIVIEMSQGGLDIRLIRPNGDVGDPVTYLDETDILKMVNEARVADGLGPINWKGES